METQLVAVTHEKQNRQQQGSTRNDNENRDYINGINRSHKLILCPTKFHGIRDDGLVSNRLWIIVAWTEKITNTTN